MNAAASDLRRRWAAGMAPLAARWRALPPREQGLVALAGAAVALLLFWLVLVQPAWRVITEAPQQLDRLDAQLQQMQRLAAETRELRGATPVPAAQSVSALQAATSRLGEKARIVIAAERATVTFNNVSADQLNAWLAEARSAARARPTELQLTRGPAGYSGTLVAVVGGS